MRFRLNSVTILNDTPSNDKFYTDETLLVLPISFILFLLIIFRKNIRDQLFLVLLSKNIMFLSFEVLIFIYSIFSFETMYFSLENNKSYLNIYLVLICITYVLISWIENIKESEYNRINTILVRWFNEKWQEALNKHENEIEWSGFDGKLNEIISNNGICLVSMEKIIFSSGEFRKGSPRTIHKINYMGDIRMYFSKTNTYKAFKIKDYYTIYSLLQYIYNKLNQWESIKHLKVNKNSSLARELKLRNEITDYLNDDILQNIIETEDTITLNQAELKDLAIEKISDLNTSICSKIHEIYPTTLKELSFEDNIYLLLEELKKSYLNIPVIYVDYEIHKDLNENYTYLFYKALQEILTNICSYKNTKNVWINMYDKKDIVMKIKAEGTFIGEDKMKQSEFNNLKEQIYSLGGSFEFIMDKREKIFTISLPT